MWAQYPPTLQRGLERASETLNTVRGGSPDGNARPVIAHLPTISCEAMGGDGADVCLAQEAWALLYDASAVMDAVQDGHATAWNSASEALAAATALFFEATSRVGQLPVSVQTVVYDHMRDVVIGQAEDSITAHPTASEALSLAEQKTGAFMDLGCWLGAQSAGVEPERALALGMFGRALGTLVQVHDDLEWLEHLGKDTVPGRERYSNVCLAWSWDTMTPPERADLARDLQIVEDQADRAVAASIRQRLIERGVRLYCATQAAALWARARSALKQACPETSEARQTLESTCDGLMAAFRLAG